MSKLLTLLVIIALPALAKTVEEAIPITISNLKGHKALFDEGWAFIPSGKKAIEYAGKGQETSKAAWLDVQKRQSERNKTFQSEVQSSGQKSKAWAKEQKENLSQKNEKFKQGLDENAKDLDQASAENRSKAFSAFTLGYLQFGKRTDEDKKVLDSINFSGLSERPLEGIWKDSFATAKEEVQREYQKSGTRSNSLEALFDMGWGYIKGAYYSVIEPGTTETIYDTIFTLNLISRVVVSTGKVFFYAGSVGYDILSPTVESGLLGALSIAEWTAAHTISAGGTGIYMINQAAVVGTRPAYQSGKWLLATAADTADYSVSTVYDYAVGTGQVAVNEVKVGVVLGGSALLALPAQTVLGAVNSAVFLVYDGPRLAIYAARGEISGVSVDQMQVGTVVDVNKLKDKGVKLEKLSDDPKDIKKVMDESQKDLSR